MVIYSSVWFEFPWLLRSFIPYFEYNCIHEYDNWNGIIRGFPFSTDLYEPDYNNFCIFIQYGFEKISISLVFDSFESVFDLEKVPVSQNGPHFHGLNEKKYSNTKNWATNFFYKTYKPYLLRMKIKLSIIKLLIYSARWFPFAIKFIQQTKITAGLNF